MVIPEAIDAESPGANTVNGPVPLSVAAGFALTTAAFRIVKLDPEATTSVIVVEVRVGVTVLESFFQEEKVDNPIRTKPIREVDILKDAIL
jgi:hypothetical protein